jgi:hypothetical protein
LSALAIVLFGVLTALVVHDVLLLRPRLQAGGACSSQLTPLVLRCAVRRFFASLLVVIRRSPSTTLRGGSESADGAGGRCERCGFTLSTAAEPFADFRSQDAWFVQYDFTTLQMLAESCKICLLSKSQRERVQQ